MKILQINKFHFVQGGADRHYLDLGKLLEERGHTVIPFSMRSEKNLPSSYSKYFVSGVDLRKPRFSFSALKIIGRIFYSLEARKKIKALIKKERPDISHLHNIYHQISPSILSVLKKNKIPIVMTVHDYKLICPNYQLFQGSKICEKCKKRKYYQCFLNKCVKNSYLASSVSMFEMYFHKLFKFYEQYVDVFICPSEFMRKKLEEWGMPEPKLAVLPHFLAKKTQALQIPLEDYILFFGRISPEKGLKQLIKVMADLPDIKLKIAGDGPEKKALETYALKNNLSNIQFLGYKNSEKLQKIISACRFVVIPSLWQEVFGLVILEAFRLGKTVIAADKGGIAEIIKEGNTGFFFKDQKDLKQKIQSLYNNPALAKELGERAKMTLAKYDPEIFYQKLLRIYRFAQAKK